MPQPVPSPPRPAARPDPPTPSYAKKNELKAHLRRRVCSGFHRCRGLRKLPGKQRYSSAARRPQKKYAAPDKKPHPVQGGQLPGLLHGVWWRSAIPRSNSKRNRGNHTDAPEPHRKLSPRASSGGREKEHACGTARRSAALLPGRRSSHIVRGGKEGCIRLATNAGGVDLGVELLAEEGRAWAASSGSWSPGSPATQESPAVEVSASRPAAHRREGHTPAEGSGRHQGEAGRRGIRMFMSARPSGRGTSFSHDTRLLPRNNENGPLPA